jgi:Rad3-related DNA helicase
VVVCKGRGNFPCEDNGLTAAEGTCTVKKGITCKSEYYEMKAKVKSASRIVANYAIYLNELFYTQSLFGHRDLRPDLLVCDEAHRLLDQLTSFETRTLDVELAEKILLTARWPRLLHSLSEGKEWCAENASHIADKAEDAVIQQDKRARQWIRLRRQVEGILSAPDDLILLKSGRVLEVSPLWPKKAARTLIQSAHNVILMSATLFGGHLLADLLGLNYAADVGWNAASMVDEPSYNYYAVPSPFPADRWPVHYRPIAALSKSAPTSAWNAMAEEVHRYVHEYHQTKGVIHVASGRQVEQLSRGVRDCVSCRDRLVRPQSGVPRADTIDSYRRGPPGTWLIHYSVGEGEDFRDDLCRIQLVAKVPYPDLGDRLTKLRSDEPGLGKKMYAAMTLNKLAQTAGRIMRHDKDYGETIILDANFKRLWTWNGQLAPSWFGPLLRM